MERASCLQWAGTPLSTQAPPRQVPGPPRHPAHPAPPPSAQGQGVTLPKATAAPLAARPNPWGGAATLWPPQRPQAPRDCHLVSDLC